MLGLGNLNGIKQLKLGLSLSSQIDTTVMVKQEITATNRGCWDEKSTTNTQR